MTKEITITDILYTLYQGIDEWHDGWNNVVLGFNAFRHEMLDSELICNERNIKEKWKLISFLGYGKPTNQHSVVVDMVKVLNRLIEKGRISAESAEFPDASDPKTPEAISEAP